MKQQDKHKHQITNAECLISLGSSAISLGVLAMGYTGFSTFSFWAFNAYIGLGACLALTLLYYTRYMNNERNTEDDIFTEDDISFCKCIPFIAAIPIIHATVLAISGCTALHPFLFLSGYISQEMVSFTASWFVLYTGGTAVKDQKIYEDCSHYLYMFLLSSLLSVTQILLLNSIALYSPEILSFASKYFSASFVSSAASALNMCGAPIIISTVASLCMAGALIIAIDSLVNTMSHCKESLIAGH